MSSLTDTTSNPRMSFTVQPEKQVTNVNTSLSSALFTSRPVNTAGAATTGTCTVTTAQWSSHQSQCCHGKAPPIDEFTSEDSRITFDDWVTYTQKSSYTWKEWTQDELLM